MSKVRTTIFLDPEVLRAVKVRAAREAKNESQIIGDALRRDLGLDLLDRLWARAGMHEDDAMALATQAQHASRPKL